MTLGQDFSVWAAAVCQQRANFIMLEVDRGFRLINLARFGEPSAHFKQGAPGQSSGPGVAQNNALVTDFMGQLGVLEQQIKFLLMLGWNLVANRLYLELLVASR